jgi:hypothetical protein
MSTRATSWLAWSLAALSVALFLAAVVLHIATLPVRPPSSWGTGGISAPLWAMLPFLPFPIVGALIASRRPRNPIGWICLAAGITWMVGMVSGPYVLYGLRMADPGSVPYPAAGGLLSEFLPPTAILLGTFLILLFPDGRLPSSRWRPVAWLCGAVTATNIVASILVPGPLSEVRNVRNPFGLEGQPWLADANKAIGLLFALCLLASASSLLLRYLRARGKRCASRSSGCPSPPRLWPSGSRVQSCTELSSRRQPGALIPCWETFWKTPLLWASVESPWRLASPSSSTASTT